jgi:hypothetical protein
MSFKWQFFFEAESGEGFGEVYWDNISSTMTAAISSMDALLANRLAILPASYYCRYAKAHDLTVKRSVAVSQLHLGEAGGFTPTAPDNIEHQVEESILLRYEGDDHKAAHKYIHGIGIWVSQGETYNPSSGFASAMGLFMASFKQKCSVASRFIKGVPQTLLPIANVIPQKVTNHKVGAPFGQSVGRRSTHVSVLTRAARLLTRCGHAIPQSVVSGLMATPST